MGGTRADVEATKNRVRKFVRYKEGAEIYCMSQSKFERLAKDANACYKIDKLVLDIVNNAYDRAETLLRENIDKLHQVAKYLIKYEKMHNQEFEAVMNGTFVEPVEEPEEEEGENGQFISLEWHTYMLNE